ncbi:MAG: hypothetical protein ACK4WH_03065 [Phycisphaerales bacterium]
MHPPPPDNTPGADSVPDARGSPAEPGLFMFVEAERLATPLRPPILGPSPTPVDPWAHRRGEPRLFAFFWTFYVMLAVAGSVTWLARAGVVTPGSYGPAARIMLVVVAVGMIVLWPMTRLSQASPRGNSVTPALADLLVVQLPVQIVVWPLYVLANWPGDIVLVVSAVFGAWGVLTGGLLALALGGDPVTRVRDPRLGGRAGWMLVFVLLVLGGPIAGATVAGAGGRTPGWLPMLSPITAIPALTGRGLIGPAAPATPLQWQMIVATLSTGVFAWALAAARNGLGRAHPPEQDPKDD